MRFEVEQKFPVADMAVLEAKLIALGASISPPAAEADLYFAHPARNFAETDEALRIRRKGTSHYLTYKGPKIDATTKTRREIELPLGSGEDLGTRWFQMLTALGFVPVGEVRKQRRKAGVSWHGRQIEASLDNVDGLGLFAELELVVAENDLEPAKAEIASLAATLGLVASERRSYLELLLKRG